jgi:hypothetical protein
MSGLCTRVRHIQQPQTPHRVNTAEIEKAQKSATHQPKPKPTLSTADTQKSDDARLQHQSQRRGHSAGVLARRRSMRKIELVLPPQPADQVQPSVLPTQPTTYQRSTRRQPTNRRHLLHSPQPKQLSSPPPGLTDRRRSWSQTSSPSCTHFQPKNQETSRQPCRDVTYSTNRSAKAWRGTCTWPQPKVTIY